MQYPFIAREEPILQLSRTDLVVFLQPIPPGASARSPPNHKHQKHPTLPRLGTAPTDKMSLSNCRFYEEKYPEIDSFVMVNVKQVQSPRVAKGRCWPSQR